MEEKENGAVGPTDSTQPVVLTRTMVEEEEKLHNHTEKEEEKEQRKFKEVLANETEKLRSLRFQRLELLLKKSSMYTAYLLSRIKQQEAEERAKQERRRKRMLKKQEKARLERQKKEQDDRLRENNKENFALELTNALSELPDTAAGRRSSKDNNILTLQKISARAAVDKESPVISPRVTRRSLRSSPNILQVQENSPVAEPRGKKRKIERRSVSPNTRRSVSPNTRGSVSPNTRGSVSPNTRGSVSPNTRRSVSPNTRESVSPNTRGSVSPNTRRSVSPNTRESVSPNSRGSVSPNTRRSFSPNTRGSVSPNTRGSVSPNTRGSVSPNTGESVSPNTRGSVSPNTRGSVSANTRRSVSPNVNGADSTEPKTRKRQKRDVEDPVGNSTSAGKHQRSFEHSIPDITVSAVESASPGREPENEVTADSPILSEPNSQTDGAACDLEERTIDGKVVPLVQPALFTGGILRDYQVEGYKWLRIIYENGINGILADEMGLGKTIQCIALIAHLIENGIDGPFLVIAPLSTVPNWISEFKQFTPQIPTLLYHGSKSERVTLRQKINKRHEVTHAIKCLPVVVTSYEIAMNDRRYVSFYDWKLIIVDEGHRLKNTQCRLIKELKVYRSTHRLLLTGTPLQNNLSELWSLLNFLLPEIFDDLSSFETWFDVELLESNDSNAQIVQEERSKNILSMLHNILNPFMLRRMKCDVEIRMPPKREVLVYAPMTVAQQELYKSIVDKSVRSLVEKDTVAETVEVDGKGRPKRAVNNRFNMQVMLSLFDSSANSQQALEKWAADVVEANKAKKSVVPHVKDSEVNVQLRNVMMMLRKCTNHPYLIEYPLNGDGSFRMDEDLVRCSGKLLMLDSMLKELKKRGHKVLLFSQMTKVLDILGDFCYVRQYDTCRLDGSMKLEDRREQIESFNTDPEVFIFLLSTRAGGLGLNLTAADTVIIFDSDWNPQNDLQAQDRCHRIGQTRPVMVYRLVTAGTVDQRIVERAAAKRKLEKMVIKKGRFKDASIERLTKQLSTVSPEELLELLQSTDYDQVVSGRTSVISNKALNSMLDRSDLYEIWEQAKDGPKEGQSQGKTAKRGKNNNEVKDIKGIFKVIQADSCDGFSAT